MPFKTLVVFAAILSCIRVEAKDTLDVAELRNLSTKLRAGDYQLVRVSPSDETAEQQSTVCPSVIPSLVATLYSSESLEARARAAEVLTLCTTENPENRQTIGMTNNKSVHTGLVRLIQDGTQALTINRRHQDEKESREAIVAATAIGNAAEAIWILTFSSAVNHEGFLQAGAIDALITAILNPHCEDRHLCSRSIMWCFAALQNLSASYCATDSGHCWWEWVEEENGEHLQISSESPIVVNSQSVREEILNHPDKALLMETVGWVCHGPVRWPHHADGNEERYLYAWPSLGEVSLEMDGDESAPSIVPWAAAGLIKNLALGGPEAREQLLSFENLEECLCDMEQSPDWLEAGKAEDSLYFLEIGDCPPPYSEYCQDYAGWEEEEEGETCESFEENNWCVEFGHHVDANGVTAKEACCACGGGMTPKEEL